MRWLSRRKGASSRTPARLPAPPSSHVVDETSHTAATADDFQGAMLAEYSKAYTSKMIRVTRQVFRDAVRWRLLTESPFADLKPGSQKSPERKAFVTREVIAEVMAAAPDDDWRLLIALSRFDGLRVPSEPLRFT